ncbi:HDOD domain-containing protein [Candidatus Reidiella endopervernicosa]|uniref:histidine kinase n=1 Tax=Candidatus Reidiella endopervernicosa TaxID=2738883 RepID=A0A6N0HW57_9GAMM|nr:HDOD domain-containing protein [Candidatus Reidiella endopervernicosa]QKQ26416.1 HDOD domain-containing protein [Candidatus Reidiella endopervernicosa]
MTTNPNKALEEIQVSRLPSPPVVLQKLIEAFAGDEASFDELASLIERDAALCAKVVAVANSPFYYRSGNFNSLKRALITLGMKTVKSISVTASVYQYFYGIKAIPPHQLNRLWQHALTTAVVARSLAKVSGYAEPDEAYMAGLFHDLGKMVLALSHSAEYREIADQAQGGRDLIVLEQQRLDISHDQVGAHVLESWGLPTFIVDAVRYHHEPVSTLQDAHHLVKITWLANIAAQHNYQSGSEETAGAANLFGFTVDMFDELRSSALIEVNNTLTALGIELSPEATDDGAAAVQSPLAEQVMGEALRNTVNEQFRDGADEGEVVDAILRSINIVFDADRALLFDFDHNTRRLRGRSSRNGVQRIEELELPVEAGRGVAILRKFVLGIQPKQTAKLNATVYAFGAPTSCVRCVITSSRLYTTPSVTLRRHKPLLHLLRRRSRSQLRICRRRRLSGTNRPHFALHGGQRRSQLIQALLTRSVIESGADTDANVLDRQIVRMLGRPAALFVPLIATDETIGVLVIGVTPVQAERLNRSQSLLIDFARDFSAHWHALRQRRRSKETFEEEHAARYNLHARKVVHEANNPLAIMRNYLALLGTKLDPVADAQEELKIIREEIDRVAGIIATLPDVSGAQEQESGAVEVNTVVKNLLRLIENGMLTNRSIELVTELDEAIPPLLTSINALKQILLNLSKNAIEAMGSTGRLMITSRDYVYFDDKAFVELKVIDSGSGLPPHVLANLFQPVDSTKGGGHAGLGLSIVKNLVDELGGKISCRSGQGGTEFQILLPRELEC